MDISFCRRRLRCNGSLPQPQGRQAVLEDLRGRPCCAQLRAAPSGRRCQCGARTSCGFLPCLPSSGWLMLLWSSVGSPHRVGSHRPPPRPLTLLPRGLSSRGPKPACLYPSPSCVPLPEHALPRQRHLLATFCLWICQPWPSPP